MDSLTTSVLVLHAVGLVSLAGLMVVAMPETFIKPVQAAIFGFYAIFK